MNQKGDVVTLDSLIEGRKSELCSHLVAKLSDDDVRDVLSRLGFERLQRKAFEIERHYKSVDNNWSQVTYQLLLRYLLGSSNKKMVEKLTAKLHHNILLRESHTLVNLEALLLGCAGLLELYAEDEYILRLKQEFQHLATKYNLSSLNASGWRLTGIHLNNHPTLRLAQFAACLHQNRLNIRSFLDCKNNKDVVNLLACETSEYWVEKVAMYSKESKPARKIGYTVSNILAINAIAPLLYTYSNYIESQILYDTALEMLYNLTPEDNLYTRQWQREKQIAHCAFETQALIQLSTEYCKRGLCNECPLAQRLISRNVEL